MSSLDEVGAAHAWRCWLCDEPVDPAMSVNDQRGPSIDRVTTTARARAKGGAARERLAHRACNTKKGAVKAVVAWPASLFVVEPAPILASVERLQRKGGREVMARCPTAKDAEAAAVWLVDRLARLEPELSVRCDVEPGGGQYLLILRA